VSRVRFVFRNETGAPALVGRSRSTRNAVRPRRLDGRAHRAAHARELLDHDGLRQVPERHPAVAARDRHADPALRGELPRKAELDRAPLLHRPDPRSDFALGEAADFVTQRVLFGIEEVGLSIPATSV
jgi:hypothetical protein